jgi:FtsH-binding integral membrane protein
MHGAAYIGNEDGDQCSRRRLARVIPLNSLGVQSFASQLRNASSTRLPIAIVRAAAPVLSSKGAAPFLSVSSALPTVSFAFSRSFVSRVCLKQQGASSGQQTRVNWTRQQQPHERDAKIVEAESRQARNSPFSHPPPIGFGFGPGGVTAPPPQVNTADEIAASVGIREHLARVYRTTGTSVAASLALAYFVSSLHLITPSNALPVLIGSAIGSLACIYGLAKVRPVMLVDPQDTTHIVSENPPKRKAIFAAFIACNGLLLAPMISMAHLTNPYLVPAASGISAAVMFAASFFAYRAPPGKLLSWGPALRGGLVALICMDLAGILALMFTGPNAFTALIFRPEPVSDKQKKKDKRWIRRISLR